MVKIKSFNSAIEAELAKGQLEANGIKAMISGNDPMRPHLELSMGVGLFVAEKDVGKAKAILETPAK
jgi:hypothetical protein